MEQSLEDRFDHPVDVMVLNAWAADMAPSAGEVRTLTVPRCRNPTRTPPRPAGNCRGCGPSTVGTLDWDDQPTVATKVYRARIDR